jgi:hypothetical protein
MFGYLLERKMVAFQTSRYFFKSGTAFIYVVLIEDKFIPSRNSFALWVGQVPS